MKIAWRRGSTLRCMVSFCSTPFLTDIFWSNRKSRKYGLGDLKNTEKEVEILTDFIKIRLFLSPLLPPDVPSYVSCDKINDFDSKSASSNVCAAAIFQFF